MTIIVKRFYSCDLCGAQVDTDTLPYVFLPKGWTSNDRGWVIGGPSKTHYCKECSKKRNDIGEET
jgi:hypothetical protein